MFLKTAVNNSGRIFVNLVEVNGRIPPTISMLFSRISLSYTPT